MKKVIHFLIMMSLIVTALSFSTPAKAVSAPEDNLAYLKPVTASTIATGFPASRAVDYRFSTEWRANVAGAGQWLRVDLGAILPITGVEMRFHNSTWTRAYVIEISNDDANWTTVVTAPGATTQQRYHPFSASARFVRWRLTSISGTTLPVRVNEFWVFGPPVTPLPPIPYVSEPPPPYISTGFVRGADVSHLMQQEHYGAVYYDVGNIQKDALQILKDHGINAIRIKIWNDPGNRAYSPANLHDPLGFNNAYWATRLAVRARQMGFRIMVDFHYSDTWADPSKQYIPHEWAGLSVQDTASALYNFTYETLQTMVEHGVTPEWVQIGNEIPGGMLWPLGRNNTSAGWDNLATFLKAGYNATKAVAPSIKVVIHYDNAGHTSQTQSFYDNLKNRGVDWDVTGLSYYPQWHGTFTQMDATMRNLASRYGKPVNIVEAAHPWTTQNFDETGNALGVPSGFPYPATVNGQIGYFNELITRIKAVPNGLGEGLFYWEPEWTPVPAAGWAIGEGSGWENAALFNQNGLVLASMDYLGNQAPVVDAGPIAAINEGDTFTSSGSFVDNGVNTWTATVDYGDGSGLMPLTLNSDKTFSLNHTYMDDGLYTVTVTVVDDEGAVGVDTTMVAVGNVAPVVYAGPDLDIEEGETIESYGYFTDPGDDIWTALVDYGDGSGIKDLPLIGKTFILHHTYLDNGQYLQIVVTVNDNDGGIGIDTALVNVSNVAPKVNTPVVSVEPSFRYASVFASATFTDPGVFDAPFTCVVNYGDGLGEQVGEVAGNTCYGPEHTYQAVGTYEVTVKITDKDGDTGMNSSYHSVIYNFDGFFPPVDNLPILNVVKAGSAVPVKFSLNGNQGLSIFASGFPVARQIPCGLSSGTNSLEETVTAGGSSLTYDTIEDQYIYVWKTNKAWAGTCRELTVKFDDGMEYQAYFHFR